MTEVQERLIEQEFGLVASPDGTDCNDSALDAICRSVDALVGAARWPLRRVSVQVSRARVEIEWADPAAVLTPAAAMALAGASNGGPVEAVLPPDRGHLVCAPLVGTFYRAPEPGAAPFVQVGDLVQAGQQIGIVEAMKLMNPVDADIAGRVVDVLVGDGEPIEYGQALVLLQPLDEE